MAEAPVDHTAEWVVPASDDGERFPCGGSVFGFELSFHASRFLPGSTLRAGWVLSHDALRLDLADLARLLDALAAQVRSAGRSAGPRHLNCSSCRAAQLLEVYSHRMPFGPTAVFPALCAGGGGAAAGEVAAGGRAGRVAVPPAHADCVSSRWEGLGWWRWMHGWEAGVGRDARCGHAEPSSFPLPPPPQAS